MLSFILIACKKYRICDTSKLSLVSLVGGLSNMLEVAFLGTSGQSPLPKRHLSSAIARYNGRCILFDAGEGTLVALKTLGWSPMKIDYICLTHYHADHILGLPGLLITISNTGRTDPVIIIGPKGLRKYLQGFAPFITGLSFKLQFQELEKPVYQLHADPFILNPFKVYHSVPCYGYSLLLPRPPKFDMNRVMWNNVPPELFSVLQEKGEAVYNNKLFTLDMISGPARKGIKITFCTDTRPTDAIVKNAEGSDLFICEGMYATDDKLDKAIETKHMLFSEAAQMAADAKVKKLCLTHFSPGLPNPKEYLDSVKTIFDNTVIATDFMIHTIQFED